MTEGTIVSMINNSLIFGMEQTFSAFPFFETFYMKFPQCYVSR